MSKTATHLGQGRFSLSEPITPFGDALTFSRMAIREDTEHPDFLTAFGISETGEEHPAPIIEPNTAGTIDEVMAALGYTVADT